MLSTMNLAKSAFGMINLDAHSFFTSFNCSATINSRDVAVRCKMQIRVPFLNEKQLIHKLLLSIFKARNIETRENKDSSPESCQIKVIENPHNGACRFVIRLLCKHGIIPLELASLM